MKFKGLKGVIILFVLALLIGGYYYYLSNRPANKITLSIIINIYLYLYYM